MRRPISIQRARFFAGRILYSVSNSVLGRVVSGASKARRRSRFIDDLCLLNDTLANTTLADRYWLWGGLLIGWAREGSPLAHDSDADFAFLGDDIHHFELAARILMGAGFKPLFRFRNNAGRVAEYSFHRHGAKFEFFLLERVGGELRYYEFDDGRGGCGEPIQAVAYIPAQPTTTFGFLSRAWRKHADHEAELTYMYGDWRAPDPGWSYMQDRAIVERVPWLWAGDTRWYGDFGEPRRERKR